MKKLTLLFACLATLFLTSCNFTEEITFNEDGSGKMSFSFDGSELMKMAGDQMSESKEETIDSTFSFKEIFDAKRDSISKLSKEEQDKLKSLESFNMHMVMNTKTSEMKFDMYRKFKKSEELIDMFKTMNNLSDMQGKGPALANDPNNPLSSLGKNGSTELNYTYNGKKFTRRSKIIDKEIHKQMIDSIGEMSMMFASSKYKLKYNFSRAIKSVSNEKALFSQDRKSITIEYNFMDYITKPEVLNLDVVLED